MTKKEQPLHDAHVKAYETHVAAFPIVTAPPDELDIDVSNAVRVGDELWNIIRKLELPLASAAVLDLVMECAREMAREMRVDGRDETREFFTQSCIEAIAAGFEFDADLQKEN